VLLDRPDESCDNLPPLTVERISRIAVARLGLIWLVACAGCGTSGEQPPVLPELRIIVSPEAGANAQFELIDVQSSGQRFTSLAGQTIAIRAPFNIIVLNARAPYGVTVRQVGDGPIGVKLLTVGGSGPERTTAGPEPLFVGTAQATLVQARPEVRFDICAPAAGQSSCSIVDGSGDFGPSFSGSIGDPFGTRLVGPSGSTQEPDVATPTVFFFQNPRFNVNGIFRSFNRRLLQVQLWINGSLEDADLDDADAVVGSDI
jgi:hypothetical protein